MGFFSKSPEGKIQDKITWGAYYESKAIKKGFRFLGSLALVMFWLLLVSCRAKNMTGNWPGIHHFDSGTVSIPHKKMLILARGTQSLVSAYGIELSRKNIPNLGRQKFFLTAYAQRVSDNKLIPLRPDIMRFTPDKYVLWLPKPIGKYTMWEMPLPMLSVPPQTVFDGIIGKILIDMVTRPDNPEELFKEAGLSSILTRILLNPRETITLNNNEEARILELEGVYQKIDFKGKPGDIFIIQVSKPLDPSAPHALVYVKNHND